MNEFDPPHRPLPAGWRLSEPYADSKQTAYVKQMVEELKKIPRIIQPPSTIQCASTQATLDRPESEDAKHWNRPLPLEMDWKREIVERDISPQEYEPAKMAQRRSKNTIGQSEEGSIDAAKREKGIHAFTYSKPADLSMAERARVTKLTEIVSTPLEPEKPKKTSWWKPSDSRPLSPQEMEDFMKPKWWKIW